ncbi:MAG: HopJ type III effector protein [Gammaproteobacteria bacterium]|nr:HopJ type III effector protein [Gammaproteobacteria bacterium]MBT8133105.1 HopJ type III effector protein [Gammaproteobacteria bacterium]NNJ49066.1 HopJ type III effector protein [Gammaproteobacteria bacterium]
MSKQLEQLIDKIRTVPETVEFQQVVDVIDRQYDYTPTGFTNGPIDTAVINKPGENEGSCKIFSFAKINDLDQTQTLNCFGNYYRDDVLNNPEAQDHANIRTFMKYGWEHVSFDTEALKRKEP